jgi:hypothetical protein
MAQLIARQADVVQRLLRPFFKAVMQPPVPGVPVIADFRAGDPQEPALPGSVDALRRCSVPTSTDRFAYRRDRMVAALRQQGYEVQIPDATFHLLPRRRP